MKRLENIVEVISGSPQFRIKEIFDNEALLYTYYSQSNMENDLVGIDINIVNKKQVRTFDKVNTLDKGDVVFSLISGKASIVSDKHQGYLYTQNYVKLVTNEKIYSKYLVYLLNKNTSIKRQFQIGLQGSTVLKYTLKQLKELEIPDFPTIKEQKIIGELYFNQLRLKALKNRVADLETTLVLEKLKEVTNE